MHPGDPGNAPDPGNTKHFPKLARNRLTWTLVLQSSIALVKMPQAPQSTRTFFVTSTTVGRRALLQSDRMAQLLVDVLAENRRKKRFLLHEFVIMPNHFHLLLTPAAEVPLEKALQLIKGGFSYRAKREIHFAFEIWQASFVNHRIRDAEDYKHHHTYIWENPVKAGLSERPELFAWSSAALGELDAAPPGLNRLSRKNANSSKGTAFRPSISALQ